MHLSLCSIRVSESDDSSLNSEELEGSASSHNHFNHHHLHRHQSNGSTCGNVAVTPAAVNNNNNHHHISISSNGKIILPSTTNNKCSSSLPNNNSITSSSSGTSTTVIGNEDSDTGLESMSSTGTPNKRSACSLCIEEETSRLQNDGLRLEINKLKCDKLDLLRQNVVSKKNYA